MINDKELTLMVDIAISKALYRMDIEDIIRKAAKLGALEALENTGAYNDLISQCAAYRRYGEAIIRSLVRSGLINSVKNGASTNSKRSYSIKEIENAILKIKINAKKEIK
jgi:hypothetical protein